MYREIDYIDLSKTFPGSQVNRASNVWKYIYIGIIITMALDVVLLYI